MYHKEKQTRCKLNLFSYLTSNGVGDLFIFKNKAKGEDYVNNLRDSILPSISAKLGHSNFIFQQDNASTHSCNLVYNFLLNNHPHVLIWPPKCPMFNIIENCWSILQKKLNELIDRFGQPKNEHMLFRYCVVAWRSINQETVDNLYSSLPKRISDYLEEEDKY